MKPRAVVMVMFHLDNTECSYKKIHKELLTFLTEHQNCMNPIVFTQHFNPKRTT